MELNVEVKTLPPVHVAYVRHVGPFQGNPELFERLFTELCTWAGPRGLIVPESTFLSVYRDNPDLTEPEKLRLDIALTVPEQTPVEGGIGKQTLEGGAYATARVKIKPHQYAAVWDALMGEWMPGSGYQPDDRPCMEVALNDPSQDPEGMHHVELRMAVKPL